MSTDDMAGEMRPAVWAALSEVLAAHDGVVLDVLGVVRYMRTDPDGDTGRYWSVIATDGSEGGGLDAFAVIGNGAVLEEFVGETKREVYGTRHDE